MKYSRMMVCAGLVAGLGLLVLGCQKKEGVAAPAVAAPDESIALVAPAEQSAHFKAVASHLELGGTVYGYIDIDGDLDKLGNGLQEGFRRLAAKQPQLEPYADVEVNPLLEKLGLTDIKAVGFSSVPDGTGSFRNRVFIYLPSERRGLLAGLGDKPGLFQRLNWAPANADFYAESEIDLPEIYETLHQVVGQVGGDQAAGKFERSLMQTGRTTAFSLLELIQNWKGRMVMTGRFDEGKTWDLPGKQAWTIPAFSLFWAVDGIAPAVRDSLDQMPTLIVKEEAGLRIYELKETPPIAGLNPVIAIKGSTLIVATNREFLTECLSEAGGLASAPEFTAALARVGDHGNGLTYYSPRLFSRLQDLTTFNPQLAPEQKEALKMVISSLPQPDQPIVSVRANLPDGILINSYGNASLKKNLMMISMYNPMTVGLMAAMAIPAFQKVRASSQEKAVMNNLRQLSAASDQYYLEHGVNTVTYDQLVGPEPDKYIRTIQSVGGEDYRTLSFKLGEPLQIAVPSLHKVVSYGP